MHYRLFNHFNILTIVFLFLKPPNEVKLYMNKYLFLILGVKMRRPGSWYDRINFIPYLFSQNVYHSMHFLFEKYFPD